MQSSATPPKLTAGGNASDDGDVTPTRIAVLTHLYPPAQLGGGPIRTLSALIDQQPSGFRSMVLTSDRDLGQRERLGVTSNSLMATEQGGLYYASINSPRYLIRAVARLRRFHPEIIYLNSFFDPIFSIGAQVLVRLGVLRNSQILLAPRGEFSAGALSLKSAKKRTYLVLYRFLRLHRTVLWHASTDREKVEILRTFGSEARVLVREDETSLPPSATSPARLPNPTLRVAYVARITEMKGLHLLLEALRSVNSAIDVSVFGSVEDPEYFARCEQLVNSLPGHVTCTYLGWLEHERVRPTLATFDLLATPTLGENFGHIFPESLSASCPVMCADVTPWTPFLVDGAGVVVPSLDPADWTAALDVYAGLSPSLRHERRIASGIAYEAWAATRNQQHVFELARCALVSHGSAGDARHDG